MSLFGLRVLQGKSLFLISLLLFLASVLNDPPWKWYSASQHVQPLGEPAHVVASLLGEGAFANPFGVMRTGPTAHVAPAFPFIQFVLIKLLGTGATGWLALRCLPTLALGLQLALLPYFGRFLGYSAWIGVLASLFGLIVKPAKEELWEAHLAGLICLFLAVSFCRWMTGPRTLGLAFSIGILGGFAFQLQPVFLLVYVAWLVWMSRPLDEVARKFVLPLCLCPIALCAPWVVRNFIALGGAFGIRDNLGVELYVSYNDCAPYGVRASERSFCYTSFHPNTSLEEASAVRSLGEYEYNKERLRRAGTWVGAHPGRTISLILQRVWYFWFPSDNNWEGYRFQRKRLLALHAMTIGSIAGLFLWFKRTPITAGILVLWLMVFPLIYYVVQFEARYRYPILWITWILSAYFVAATVAQIASYFSGSQSPHAVKSYLKRRRLD